MAACSWCHLEMMTADGCTLAAFPADDRLPNVARVPFGSGGSGVDSAERAVSGRRCHDCNVLPGQYHHPGCDAETCPVCGGQAIGCNCGTDGNDDEEVD